MLNEIKKCKYTLVIMMITLKIKIINDEKKFEGKIKKIKKYKFIHKHVLIVKICKIMKYIFVIINFLV